MAHTEVKTYGPISSGMTQGWGMETRNLFAYDLMFAVRQNSFKLLELVLSFDAGWKHIPSKT